jgi:hypothetical protein
MAAWNYFENGGRHAELIWHRRSGVRPPSWKGRGKQGKDEICLHRTCVAAFERVAGYWHMLPEASQARKAIWAAVNPHTGRKRIDEAFPLALRKNTRENEMSIEFVNGSTWQVVGSDNFNSLVGSAPAGIVYSEWALSNPSTRAYLRPILAENGGWQIFISTPRGKNHAFKTFGAAQKEAGAFAQCLSALQTNVFSAEQLAAELASYKADFGVDLGQSMYDQEYLVSFDAAILGAVLGRWMSRARAEGRIVTDGVVFDPEGAPVCISSDIGFRDTASWWFWQPRADGFGIVDYMGGTGMDADEWADKLEERLAERGMRLDKIWLPHDAKAKTFATKHSPAERFIRQFGTEHVRIVPQTKISDRINAARRVVDRCWFEEEPCEDGISGLTSWHFDYDTEAKEMSKEPVHDWASHPGDAFSYGCQMLELTPPAKPARPEPKFLHNATFADLSDWQKRDDALLESDGFQ